MYRAYDEAATFGSSWRIEPAAALRGFAKPPYHFFSFLFILSSCFLGSQTSPSTIALIGFASVSGTDSIVLRLRSHPR